MNDRLRVLMLPPIHWLPARKSYVPGTAPDPFILDKMLGNHGIDLSIIDPYPLPYNPFAGQHNLIQSLDPWRTVRVLARESQFDVIVSVFEGAALPLLKLRKIFAFGTPIVMWDIGLTDGWRLRKLVQNQVVPYIDGIMVLGGNQKDYISNTWPTNRNVEVIGHYVDGEFFCPSSKNQESYIFTVGDDPGRDYNTLLGAASNTSIDLVMRTNFDIDLNGNQRIHHIKDRVSFTDLHDLYARAAIVVIPLSDTLNASGISSFLEAASMGKPIIVSKSKGIEDFVVPGENCIEVPCHDPVALQSAIDKLIQEPETRARLGRNARSFFEKNSSAASFGRRFSETLRKLAKRQNQ